jgi:DNA polymerase-4
MPTVQARRLCPQGKFVDGHGSLYADFSEQVFAVCRRFTPMLEPASIDEGYMEMTGTAAMNRLSEGSPFWPVAIAEQLKRTVLSEIGLSVSIGIGSNKLIAKIASKCAKPNGIACVLAGNEKKFLRPMKVDALPGIGKKTVPQLHAMNIVTVGDLQDTPMNVLMGMFGVMGEDFYQMAHGIGAEELAEAAEPKSVSRGTTLQRDTMDVIFLKRVLKALSVRVGRHLRRLGYWATQATVHVRYHDFTHVGKQGAMANPTHYDHEIHQAACRLFDMVYRGDRPVRYVCVGASRLTRLPMRQLELWEPLSEPVDKKYGPIYQAIDATRVRFGEKALRLGVASGGENSDEEETLSNADFDEDGAMPFAAG